MTWQELEKRVCGDPVITVEALKKSGISFRNWCCHPSITQKIFKKLTIVNWIFFLLCSFMVWNDCHKTYRTWPCQTWYIADLLAGCSRYSKYKFCFYIFWVCYFLLQGEDLGPCQVCVIEFLCENSQRLLNIKPLTIFAKTLHHRCLIGS